MLLSYCDDGKRKTLKYTPLSSYMNPCEIDQFPKLMKPLRGHGLQDVLSVFRAVGQSGYDIKNYHLAGGLQRLAEF